VLQSAPQSVAFTVLGGIDAIELGRPREGLAILQRLDARQIPMSEHQAGIYWGFVSYAKHDLAMIEQDSNGGRIPPGSVLADLADSAAVERQVEEDLEHPETPELPGRQCAAMELRAHGSVTAGVALLDRIAAARGPVAAAEVEDTPCLWGLYSPHYYAGRLLEARAAYERRVAGDPHDVKAHAALAAIAARLRDSTALDAQLRWLETRQEAFAYFGRAKVAALQGEAGLAVSLLREALRRNLERHFLHLDPDLDPLKDYPPFRDLMRFRG
jgi:hypothetical protein